MLGPERLALRFGGYPCLTIEQILETAQLDVESSNDVAAAVKDYRSGTADFADCLLVRVNSAVGCSHTVTFDRRAAKLKGFELPK